MITIVDKWRFEKKEKSHKLWDFGYGKTGGRKGMAEDWDLFWTKK